MAAVNFLEQTLFKISSFVFYHRQKLIQVWNNIRVSKFLVELSLIQNVTVHM